jgi:hypothetical protein
MTPYEVVYGHKQLSITSHLPGTSKVQAVDHTFHTKEAILHILKDNLVMTQNRMKQQAGQDRSNCSLATADQVFLHLQPYKKTSLKDKTPHKLAPKFYGPYEIIQRIGQVAYKLAHPTHSKIHPIFHVSCLNKVIGSKCKVQSS